MNPYIEKATNEHNEPEYAFKALTFEQHLIIKNALKHYALHNDQMITEHAETASDETLKEFRVRSIEARKLASIEQYGR